MPSEHTGIVKENYLWKVSILYILYLNSLRICIILTGHLHFDFSPACNK